MVVRFEGGAITPNAGALPLGATNRAIRLTERFAKCFTDRRPADHVEDDLRDRSAASGGRRRARL